MDKPEEPQAGEVTPKHDLPDLGLRGLAYAVAPKCRLVGAEVRFRIELVFSII